MKDPVRLVRRFCFLTGWYGILTRLPLLFMETKFGSHLPPVVNQPEFYYGFIGLALSWNLAFLMISRDPLAHRAFLVPAGIEKLAFAASSLSLIFLHKAPNYVGLFGGIDLLLAIGFFLSFWRLSALTM